MVVSQSVEVFINRIFWVLSMLCAGFMGASVVQAQTWLPTPASGDWNTAANWDSNVVPNATSATATFGVSGTAILSNNNADVTLSGIQFNSGASAYTLDNNLGQFVFQGAGIVNLSGQTQRINNEGNLIFENSSSAGNLLVMGSGSVTFTDSATAGTATFVNQGNLDFNTSSSANSSSITNSGNVLFEDNSTAGNSTVVNNGTVSFGGSALGGNASITNGGSLLFDGNSNAVSVVITNNANLVFESSATASEASINNTSTGSINFHGTSGAGAASILNDNYIAFNDNSSAVSAVITNNGLLQFNDSSTAGNAQVNSAGHLIFTGLSTAGSATITTQSGGNTAFSSGASGGTAKFITNAGGVFDDSGVTTGGVTVGSIEGAGTYRLGANDLATGTNNLSTTVSGLLVDGGAVGGTGGSLTKLGTGTLTLSGDNSYSGGTTVALGTLNVDTGGSLGTGSVYNNSALNYINGSTAANLSIDNENNLNFDNRSTAGSASVFNDSNLYFNDSASAGSATINNDGYLIFGSDSAVTFSTAGNAVITSDKHLEFDGYSSAADSTITNSAGFYFQDNSTAANSKITTSGSGTVYFLDNSLGGTAQLTAIGSGYVDISNHLSPSVTVGSINGSGNYYLGSNNLTTGMNDLSTTVTGSIDDGGFTPVGGVNNTTGGSLTKMGTGTLTLLGANSYSGETMVADGALALGGAGLLVNGSLALDGGTLETSGGPATIQVHSNYIQASGGTLLLALDNGGLQDAVSVGGDAIIAGTLSLVYGNGFQLNLGDSVTIMTANGFSGMFDQWNNPSGDRLFPIYGPTQLSLESVLPTFQISGLTANEKAVAGALDNGFEDSTHYALMLNLVGQNESTLPGIYSQIDPSGLSSLYQMNFMFSRTQASLIDQRLEADALQGDDPASAWKQGEIRFAGNLPASQEQAVAQNLSRPDQWGSFVSGSGDFGTLSGDGNANGYKFTVSGLTAGADYGFGTDVTGGLLLGFAQGTANITGGGEVDFSGGQLGLYGGWHKAGVHAEVLVEGGLNSVKYQQAGFGGTASASPTGKQYSGNLDLGYDFEIEKLKVGPLASLQYSYASFGAFNETGSGAPLAFPSQGESSLTSDLGSGFTEDFKWGSVLLSPSFSAAWEHVYEGDQDSLSANLGSAFESFTVAGPATGQNAFVAGVGLEAMFNNGPALFARYQDKVGMANYTEQNLEGGVKIGF